MQVSSKLLTRTAIVLLGVLLAMVVFVAVNNQQASALNASQWDIVRGYVAEYFGGPQYDAGLEGEAGFRMSKTDLWNRIDSNSDIMPAPSIAPGSTGTAVTGVAGEGDNMVARPVIVDNLMTNTGVIPGTEFRCNWSTNESCFSDTSITTLRQIVDNHQAAGFSTDIIDYCVSAHTAAPTTGGFGIIAQVPGALASDTSLTPNVYTFEYARNGWRDNVGAALVGANAMAASESSAGGFAAPATVANCNASATDYDLVRCQANWAISSTGGNVGSGQQTVATIAAAAQSVDIRVGAASTISSTGTNMQIPINTLFTTSGLANLDPLASTIMVSRTQMGGDAAIGLEMLGYNNIAGGYINGGLSRWNSTGAEQQVDQNIGLPLQSITAWTAPGPIDMSGPTSASVTVSNVDASSADIERTASEPATMKVELSTTGVVGSYTEVANDTVLNAVKDIAPLNGDATHLSGLTAGTTYFYKVTSYDGYANGIETTGSFATTGGCVAGKPSLSLAAPAPFWGSYADYLAKTLSVTWTVNNTGTSVANNVNITSSNSTYAPITTVPGWATIGNIAAGGSGSTVIQYVLPTVGNGFRVVNAASAEDCAANGYTYP